MRKHDYNCSILCRMQGNLFMHFMDYESCSPSIFIRRFMNSELVTRFDNLEILLERSSNASLVSEIDEQYGITNFGNPKQMHPEALFWMGYVYRYWCFTREISSKHLYAQVKPEELYNRYYIYHSFGMEYLIERLEEELHVVYVEQENKTLMQVLEEFSDYVKTHNSH